MENALVLPVQRGRVWLPVQYGQQEVRFAYPAVQGTHHECFTAINKDKELRPAEGLELALLTFGAYNSKEQEWKDIRQTCFIDQCTRASCKLLLIPAGPIASDASLSGVLIERDINGIGLTKEMQVPDLSQWEETEGVYHLVSSSAKAVFVPSSAYEGKSFEQDRIAHAHLTPEGAELFAKTARDAGKNPHNWIARRMKEIKLIEQRVSLLHESSYRLGYRLGLNSSGWGVNRYSRAFGVSLGASSTIHIALSDNYITTPQ